MCLYILFSSSFFASEYIHEIVRQEQLCMRVVVLLRVCSLNLEKNIGNQVDFGVLKIHIHIVCI